jgi:serine/threonine protein kinase
VEFIGAYISSSNKPSFVMEFCANGSMYDAMNNKDIAFDWNRVLTWMIQSVRGIEALHGINLVHRDIKSLNLLMDKYWTVKGSDLAKIY